MDLSTATDDLYAGGLEHFMPQRAALAKAAKTDGDKALAAEIAKLRKPSVSAWTVNMLVRDSPDEVGQLIDLGAAFRQAQDALDGGELRELSQQRQALIGAVVGHARDIANELGRSLSDALATEVEQTLRAAMADPDAAEAVRGGALTIAISASGLGSLKISDVAASTRPVLEIVRSPAPSKRAAKGKPDPKVEAERAEREAEEARKRTAKLAAAELAEAERAADIATDKLKAAADAVAAANAQRNQLRAALDDLEKQVARAEKHLVAADDAVADAKEDQKLARKGVTAAERAVKAAREAVAQHD